MDEIQALNVKARAEAKAANEAEEAAKEQARLAPLYAASKLFDADAVRADHAKKESWAIDQARDRAQKVLNEYGDIAPKPVMGENSADYRRRVLAVLAPNTRYASNDVRTVPSDVLDRVEAIVYADALENRWHPADLKPGQMRKVTKLDATGRRVEEFVTGKGTGPEASVFKKIYATSINQVINVMRTDNLKPQAIL